MSYAASFPSALRADEPLRARRVGLAVLFLGFGGFLAWAALAPLDEGVPSSGSVAIDTKRKAVQHLTGGIVREVLVREGQQVRAGEPLMRLDEAAARASYEAARQRYLAQRATQARLLAERGGADAMRFHPDLLREASDPLVTLLMATQQQLFAARRAALRADLRSLQEGIEGHQALIRSLQEQTEQRSRQLALLREELEQTRGLVLEGYAPRNRQLELERMGAEAQAALAELRGNALRAQRAIGELRERQVLRRQEYSKEIEGLLAELAGEVDAAQAKVQFLREDLERTDIRSPASGQVVGIAVQTVGAVVSPGQKLMDVVPDAESLLLESRIPPHVIDRVHAGLPVDVRFAAFANTPQLVVDGRVVSVSGDLLTEQQTNVSYYLARVALTPEGMHKLGRRNLQPGMPVEVVLKTGERSLLAYLLHPLAKRMAAAMKED